ncbi:MAG: primosomal protein N' [Victivallaceae bacterium]|nr:primosomal protein N' [Victivallaceae bacterium]
MTITAKVIVNLALDRAFDYLVPEALREDLCIGSRVNVPFGHGSRDATVIAIEQTAGPVDHLKSIGCILPFGSIPPKLLALGRFLADYYCCSFEQAVKALLPGAVRRGKIKEKSEISYFAPDRAKAEAFLLANQGKKNAAKRCEILKFMLPGGEFSQGLLAAVTGATPGILKTLLKDGLVAVEEHTVRRNPFRDENITPSQPLEPSPEQAAALRQIDDMLEGREKRRTMLLFGVTNSGKTEVYLQAIAKAMDKGLDAIVLVPEISLTPQTVRRFRARFGDLVSVLHSRLTDGERFDEFLRITRGEVRIAVGARSALFAPFAHLGLIIVDEEHDGSYKQSESPRYHARDVAVMRGQLESAVVILGSGTPSAESMLNAMQNRYVLAAMPTPINQVLPPVVRVVDLRLEKPEEGHTSYFSKLLVDAVQERIEKGEQSIIFLNRKGYSTSLRCTNPECKYIAKCPDCSVPYTYSRLRKSLSCHLCGGLAGAPERCPECGAELRCGGAGTERLESMAMKIFSDARVGRMDSDNMRRACDYEKILERFRRGDLDLLIGTQMIAKGLHFPNVTLVGIVNADRALDLPDFRAAERTFQLITQVAGRAGRGDVRGEVIIQTFAPDNDAIRCAAENNYQEFRDFDFEFRKALEYPPFGRLILVHFRSPEERCCMEFAESFKQALLPCCHENIKLTGPKIAAIPVIDGKYRCNLMIRGKDLKQVRLRLRELVLHMPHPRNVEFYADVDAQQLL